MRNEKIILLFNSPHQPHSLCQSASIGITNGFTYTPLSSFCINRKKQSRYCTAFLISLIVSTKTCPPTLKGRIGIASLSPFVLIVLSPIPLFRITSSPQEKKSSIESREKKKKELLPEILEFYNVPPSKYNRRYPPISKHDTHRGPSGQERVAIVASAQALIEKLKPLRLEENDDTVESRFKDPSPTIYKQLALLLKNVYPETELHLLSRLGHHGYSLSYQDSEILSVSQTTQSMVISGIEFRFSEKGKPILLQQATRGCTAACTGMLIYEHSPTSFNHQTAQAIRGTNLGTIQSMIKTLKSHNLQPTITQHPNIETMKSLIAEKGSAIVSVNSCGGHVVIVDEITDNAVIIRDPHHGWEVTLKRKAFEKSLTDLMIQVVIEKG